MAVADARYALVFDESLRGVREQYEALRDVRAHAAQLLAAASVAASFLGALVLRGPRPAWAVVASWAAVAAFLGLVGVCVWIVVPRRGTVSLTSARVLLDHYVEAEEPVPIDAMRRELALWLEQHWDENQQALNARLTGLRLAAVLLGTAIAAWCVTLIGG
jgi:hypothetical protein